MSRIDPRRWRGLLAARWPGLVALALSAMLALDAAYEFGRHRAGFDAARVADEQHALEKQLAALESERNALRLQSASAEELRVADVRERSELSSTIGELQAQLERQQQEVEFYRGLAQPGQNDTSQALHVQQFRISAQGDQRYLLRFSLNRVTRPGESIAGVVGIMVDGVRDGRPSTLDLASMASGVRELSFNFRYTTTLEQSVTLPVGFRPDRVTISVRPALIGATPYRQIFLWNVEPG